MSTADDLEVAAPALGPRLAEARKQRGWTLREAERRTGVANAHLSQIETGAILRPSLDILVPLAAVYGLPLDELAAAAGHDVEAIVALAGAVRVSMITAGEAPAGPEPDLPPDGQWAVVELLGHRQRLGYLTQIERFGVPLLHIDLPGKLWGGDAGAWEEYAGAALYGLHPTTREEVRAAWEREQERARRARAWEESERTRWAPLPAGQGAPDDEDIDELDYAEGDRPF